jgi:hypothetical protein
VKKNLRKIGEKYFGEDYLQFILAAGVACDVSSEVLAKELETTIAAVEEMRAKYRGELTDLRVHASVLAEIYEELSRIRLTNIAMKLQDSLIEDLEGGKLEPKEKSSLLQFLTKSLEAKKVSGRGEEGKTPESQKEYHERVRRLAEGTGLTLVK